jgi:hypothetical protein
MAQPPNTPVVTRKSICPRIRGFRPAIWRPCAIDLSWVSADADVVALVLPSPGRERLKVSRRSRPSRGRTLGVLSSQPDRVWAPLGADQARRATGVLGRAPLVSMMKTADLRDRNNGGVARRHDRSRNRRVFVQRQVRAGPLVVRTIERHQPLQAHLVEHDHVIETLATNGTNESLDERILPGRAVP